MRVEKVHRMGSRIVATASRSGRASELATASISWTLIGKAIDKDPQRRYLSGEELAEDLRRFIEDQPIKARRASLSEVAVRWMRKHQVLAASLSAIAILLTFLAVASPLALIREAWLRDEAETARELAEQREQEIRRNLYFAELNLGMVQAVDGARSTGVRTANAWRGSALTIR